MRGSRVQLQRRSFPRALGIITLLRVLLGGGLERECRREREDIRQTDRQTERERESERVRERQKESNRESKHGRDQEIERGNEVLLGSF